MSRFEYFAPDDRELNPCSCGRRLLFKGSSSKSSSSTSTTTIDNRMVVDGGIGLSNSKGNTITVNSLDADVVKAALDTVAAADATNGDSFSALLSLAGEMFDRGADILDSTAQTTMAQVSALNTAQNDQNGAIDQKTIIALAVAGVAAAAVFGAKK